MVKQSNKNKEYITTNPSSELIWQDRELRFDCSINDLQPRSGEFEIDSLLSVEDTKGNNGEKGALVVTNLRLIWVSKKNPTLNLSVGHSCIANIQIKSSQSRLKGGLSESLYLLTKFNNSKFEFIFTNYLKNTPRLFTTVQAVHKSYETTKMYRDLKLRCSIINEKELICLPKERKINTIKGVWNLSTDQGNLGTFIITNIRVVWFAELAENFNVSIPYIQMKTLRVKNSKFGSAFVIETKKTAGGFVLGFRVDPFEKLKSIYDEVSSLHYVCSQKPEFGIDFKNEERPPSIDKLKVQLPKDQVKIVGEDDIDPLAAYYSDDSKQNSSSNFEKPVFNAELGLATEPIKEGFDISKLWNPINTH